MTDYNDGKWHDATSLDGWPVHEKSIVRAAFRWRDDSGSVYHGEAGKIQWAHDNGRVEAFRVTEPHREPRTVWAVGAHIRDTLDEAKEFCDLLEKDHPGKGYGDYGQIKKFVEVLE